MGLEFDAISERETIAHVLEEIADGRGGWICPVNLDVLRQWRASTEVRELVSAANLVLADGMPLIWAGGLRGTPLPERVAGSSLIVTLSSAAARAGAPIFLLGGNPGSAELATEKLLRNDPELRVARTLCPPFGFEQDPDWLDRIEQALLDARPAIVFVGLGFPKQERLIARLRSVLPSAWFVSCGISFSFVAGEIQRAPVLVQRLGFEWLHRLAQEPRRLYQRYLIQGIPFLLMLLSSSLAARVNVARRVGS